MPDKGNIDEILAAKDAAATPLTEQEASLQAAITEIDDIEWERPLSATERRNREKLRAAQTACRASLVELSYVTARALDQSAEVQRLANSFVSINKDLKQSLECVKKIAKVAANIAKGLGAIEKVGAKLLKLVG